LNLIVEVTGEKRKDKAATARTLWVPAINNHGTFGRWAFLEVADPWDAQKLIRGFWKQAPAEAQEELVCLRRAMARRKPHPSAPFH
jgi:type III restriction enzyme